MIVNTLSTLPLVFTIDDFFSDFQHWFILEVKNTETHSVGSRLFTWLCDWDVPNLRRLKNCLWLNQAGF